MALDLTMLQSKTSEAQAEAFKESLRETAARDVGIFEAMELRSLNFVPASTMNDRAAAAGKAACLMRGDNAANADPTCAHHAITNIFEESRTKAMDAVVREMMNITNGIAATDAKKIKAMRTSVGCFSSLAVVRAHLPVLEVNFPPLIQGLCHRREVPAVARRGPLLQE
eukprot:3189642-Pleurochrysis_carterae.AAC.1